MSTEEIAAEEQQAQYQKWEIPFQELLDEIYWSGYSEALLETNPEAYAREYWYFIRLYE